MNYKTILDKIVVVVVLYNTKFSESASILSLSHCALMANQKISLFVYDNSSISYSDYDEKKFPYFVVQYVHDPSNPGVSKAYNECVRKYKNVKKWIMLLDQDTEFGRDSLLRYVEAINNQNSALYVPKIFDKNNQKLISPCKFIHKRGSHLDEKSLNLGSNSFEKVSFINSGSLILIEAFIDVGGYNENLFDISDHEFFERFSKKYKCYFLVDLSVVHELSSSINTNSLSTKNRFRMFCKASKYYGKKTKSIFPLFWAFLRGLKLVYINMDIRYIKIYFKNMISK